MVDKRLVNRKPFENGKLLGMFPRERSQMLLNEHN